jgi:hypothetical protein
MFDSEEVWKSVAKVMEKKVGDARIKSRIERSGCQEGIPRIEGGKH